MPLNTNEKNRFWRIFRNVAVDRRRARTIAAMSPPVSVMPALAMRYAVLGVRSSKARMSRPVAARARSTRT